MKSSDPILLKEYLAVLDDGGMDTVLFINDVPVGRIQWNAVAAAKAIAEAIDLGEQSQAEVQALLGSKASTEEAGRLEAIGYAATVTAYGLGAELRTFAPVFAHKAVIAPSVAKGFYTHCPGCGRRFVPGVDRKRPRDKKKARAVGRRAAYCSAECQRLNHNRRKTPAEKAAAEQQRRDDKVAESVGLKDAAALKAILKDPIQLTAYGKRLRGEAPKRYKRLADYLWRRGDFLPS